VALQFDTTTRNNMLGQLTTSVGSSGYLNIYSGTEPSSCAAALSGNTLLVSLPCSATFAPAASGGVLTVNAITQTNAAASGTATFFRLMNNAQTSTYAQGTVATSGGDLNINTTTIASGGPIVVSSWTITAPGA